MTYCKGGRRQTRQTDGQTDKTDGQTDKTDTEKKRDKREADLDKRQDRQADRQAADGRTNNRHHTYLGQRPQVTMGNGLTLTD